jgi:hypothetical protein
MKRGIISIAATVLVLGFSGMARADIVELDLFDLGCPTEFNWDSPYWKTNFDLGVTFTEISNVYMDWSGEITAGLVIDRKSDEPFPEDVGIYAYLGANPELRVADVWGGKITYPEPQAFDCGSDFELTGPSTWSDLLDGQGAITIGYTGYIILDGRYIEPGNIVLNSATLVVAGTIVPEPVSILLLAMGTILFRIGTRRTSRNIRG